MNTLETQSRDYKGFTIKVSIHPDEMSREPWKEHDGHGEVSEWSRGNQFKAPGERVLCEDHGSYRFYDWNASMQKAKAEGWGISDKAKLASKLNKPVESLTQGEIIAEAVRLDFEHLRAWCNNEWQWVGYTAEIWRNESKIKDAEASCWGYESNDMEHVWSEAFGEVEAEVDQMDAEETESAELVALV